MEAEALIRVLTPERATFVRFARRSVGSDADAEDLVQRALLRASSRATSVADPARARAWFYRILRRTIVDHHRAREHAVEPLDGEPPASSEPVAAACPCAVRLLGELRPAYAEVLRAVDFDGGDVAELAARLGVTTQNLHVRLHRARRVLREKVMRHCGVHGASPCLDCSCDTGRCCGGAPARPLRSSPAGDATMAPSERIVREYVEAFYRGDVASARRHLAEDVTFVGPSANIHGADALLRAAGHVAHGVTAIEVQRVFVDGSDVALFYDLLLDHAVERVSVAEWDVLRGDRIASIRLVLDTAPFTPRAPARDQVIDPVCGMRVAKSSPAATREHAGATYYFCSEGCAESFAKAPAEYLK